MTIGQHLNQELPRLGAIVIKMVKRKDTEIEMNMTLPQGSCASL